MTTDELIRKGRRLERKYKKDLAKATRKLERKARKELPKAAAKIERKVKKDLPKAAAKLERKAEKRWKHLSSQERTFIIAGVVVQLTLLAAAQADISRRDRDQIRGKKWVWRLLVLISFVGPLAYFMIGRKKAAPTATVTDIGDSAVA